MNAEPATPSEQTPEAAPKTEWTAKGRGREAYLVAARLRKVLSKFLRVDHPGRRRHLISLFI
jgi:hypothetical protein